jgi:4-amino-4-deoxy-L-arabinose transferase-like glycosyltransferase
VSGTVSPTSVEAPAHGAAEKQPVSDTPGRGFRSAPLALAGVLVLAAALRIVGSRYGLPYPLLNPDEANIVPRAWAMSHGGGLDPGWYDYPSLLMALLAPLQAFFDEPSYGAARIVAVAIGLVGVAAAWWLGRRAYGTGAGLVGAVAVAVATTHVAYSRMAVTDLLLTLGVTVTLALAIAGRLELAGLAAGLAASAKYPGAVLLVPILVAGWGRWRQLAATAAVGALAFALTSPFVLVNAGQAWDDISRVQRLARAGWLGFEDDPVTPLAFLDRLWETLGPFLALALAGFVVAVVRRRRADLVLASFAIAYWLYLMPLEAHFDRYVLPLVPVLAVFAGRLRATVPVALVLLTVPLAWSLGDAAGLTRTDARVRADAWISANVPVGDLIAADPGTLPLRGRRVLRLRLPGPSQPEEPRRNLARLHAKGVRWVLVSGAVTDRVLAARERYPREARFYAELARAGVLRFAAERGSGGLGGPWVRVYRL